MKQMDVILGDFEWDSKKSKFNYEKHGIAFEDATVVFEGSAFRISSDRSGEIRRLAVGETQERVIAVIYTERNGRIRIISARMARTNEREIYRQRFGDTS